MEVRQRGMALCLAAGFVIAMALRYKLLGAETFDYVQFLQPWIQGLREEGLSALDGTLPGANYNAPYYFLLYLATFLPFSDLVAIKLVSILFDCILAFGVLKVVGHFHASGYAKYVAALLTLFLPTVFLNSSLWGQCDAVYSSFIIFSLYAVLKNHALGAWLLWGIAFGFKLQAIFFLPFLVFVTLSKAWKWRYVLVAPLIFLIITLPPVIAGRPLGDTLGVYVLQAQNPTAGQQMLSWFAPTLGQIFPSGGYFYEYFKSMLLAMGAFAGLAVISLAFVRNRYSDTQLLLIAAISLLLIPLLLPGIHERYLFAGEIVLFIVACVRWRLAWAAIAMQIITIMTYNSYFTGGNQPPYVPYAIMSLVVIGIIYVLAKDAYFDELRTGLGAKIKN